MPFKPRLTLVALAVAVTYPPVAARAQSSPQEERIAASFVLSLGRTATPAEISQWTTQDPRSARELIARHRRQIEADPAAQRAVIAKARHDAVGPGSRGNPEQVGSGVIYTELVQRHLQWLAQHPAEYEQVMHRAYRLLLERDAYSVEIDYWRRQPALSFALLVGCIEDWARRSQPGLTATTGTAAVSINSAYLATVRLSPGVAAEARAAAGLVPAGDSNLAVAAGRVVVAPGADGIVSVGGIYFAAAGADSLASAPAGK